MTWPAMTEVQLEKCSPDREMCVRMKVFLCERSEGLRRQTWKLEKYI